MRVLAGLDRLDFDNLRPGRQIIIGRLAKGRKP